MPIVRVFTALEANNPGVFANYTADNKAFELINVLGWRDWPAFEQDMLSFVDNRGERDQTYPLPGSKFWLLVHRFVLLAGAFSGEREVVHVNRHARPFRR